MRDLTIDPLLIGLLQNVAQHEPVRVVRLPGMVSLHDNLAELGLLKWLADDRAVVSEAGWRLLGQAPPI